MPGVTVPRTTRGRGARSRRAIGHRSFQRKRGTSVEGTSGKLYSHVLPRITAGRLRHLSTYTVAMPELTGCEPCCSLPPGALSVEAGRAGQSLAGR
jgi:hypothetical protein